MLLACRVSAFLVLLLRSSTPPLVVTTPEARLTLVLAGDVMLGRGVAQALDGDWQEAFRPVRPWLSAGAFGSETDHVLVFANLESPLTTWPQLRDGYDLRAPPAAAAALRGGGFDAVSLANNHALDAGEVGLQETLRALHGVGIVPWIDRAPVTNAAAFYQGLAFDDSLVPLDVDAAAASVAAAAKQAGRDGAVVVSIHWGGEYQAAPSARQRVIAEALAAAGARVIVGHGPHVLQRVAWLGETLVAYSLGNFVFDQPYPVECSQGAILRVTLQGGQIRAVQAFPTVSRRGRVYPADPETADAVMARLGLGP
jgi:poly-gamma-glutamate synthesis protein (capsule biosynthesis protein)